MNVQMQRLALDLVAEAVVATDPTGLVTYWNASAERIYGIKAAEVLGRDLGCARGCRWPDPGEEKIVQAALQRAGYWRGQAFHGKRGGEEILVDWEVVIVRDSQGLPEARIEVVRAKA
jgi:two-component system, cell cycle sensor histidine kinase and response regulator CckA